MFDAIMKHKETHMAKPPSQKKISQTLLEYAEPMIQKPEMDISSEDLKANLSVALGIWNAAVLASCGNASYLQMTRQAVGSEMAPFIDFMVQRKMTLFQDHHFLMSDLDVCEDDVGECHVRVAARDAPKKT